MQLRSIAVTGGALALLAAPFSIAASENSRTAPLGVSMRVVTGTQRLSVARSVSASTLNSLVVSSTSNNPYLVLMDAAVRTASDASGCAAPCTPQADTIDESAATSTVTSGSVSTNVPLASGLVTTSRNDAVPVTLTMFF